MSAVDETEWMRGNRAAYVSMLGECLRQLGIEDTQAGDACWVLEREAAIVILRELCEEHGDNDWPNDLHLADVIEKHLARHLD